MSEPSSTESGTLMEESGPDVGLSERRVVHLQVGETVFTTTEHTLCKESPYFRSLLSDRNQQLPSGDFFVDADPDLFSYILQYLRHGIYPHCIIHGNGHDIATYVAIQRVAADFGIEKLAKWLVDRRYESAVECSVSFQETRLRESTPYSITNQVSFLPYPSTNHGQFPSTNHGRIYMVKTSFTARPEAFS